MSILPAQKNEGYLDGFSVVDGCNKGLAKWSWVCPPEIDKDVRADEGAREVAADPDLDNGVLTSPERPHRPWLVPGAGRL